MTKKAYSRPIIQRQYMGAANKFGGFSVLIMLSLLPESP